MIYIFVCQGCRHSVGNANNLANKIQTVYLRFETFILFLSGVSLGQIQRQNAHLAFKYKR